MFRTLFSFSHNFYLLKIYEFLLSQDKGEANIKPCVCNIGKLLSTVAELLS